MKQIVEYLLSKTNNKLSPEYFVVYGTDNVYFALGDLFPWEMIKAPNNFTLWILSKPQILDFIDFMKNNDKKTKLKDSFKVCYIPQNYDEKTIKDGIKAGKIKDKEDLEEINIDELQ